MTDQPIDPTVRDVLRDHVESHAQSGDFDAVWRRAQQRSRPPTRWVGPLALAAVALLVLGLPARQAYQAYQGAGETPSAHAGSGVAVPGPVPITDADPWAEWSADAIAATPKAERPALFERGALTALHRHDLDRIKDYGMRSGTPTGLFLAAEMHLVDLEVESALALFEQVKNDPTAGPPAQMYLTLCGSSAAGQALAEIAALARIGEEATACDHLHEMWPEGRPDQQALVAKLAPGLSTCGVPGFPQ